MNSKIKLKFSRLAFNGFGISPVSKTMPMRFRTSSYSIVRSKEFTPKVPSQILAIFKEFANSSSFSREFRTRLRPFNLNLDRSSVTKGTQKRFDSYNRSSLVKSADHKKRFYRYRDRLFKGFSKDVMAISKENTFYKKLHLLQKLVYALRLQKTVQPSLISFRKSLQSSRNNNVNRSSNYYRPYKRSLILRFFKKRRKKIIRRRKFARLKTVHFFIPSYIQIDFRTLRAVKVESPSQEDIYHSFRGSMSKVYSFYASRGFL